MIHRRQFIISKNRILLPDFNSVLLNNKYFINYHKELNVEFIGNCVLLGYAFSSVGSDLLIEDDIEHSIRTWAGRWVLVTPSELYLDAAGTLGIFYGFENGNLVISSSLALLHTCISNSEWYSKYDLNRLDFHFFDYYPAPFTPWSKCMALLPSQKIDLVNMRIVNRSDFNFSRYSHLSKDELIKNIIDQEGTILKNINYRFNKSYLPLTAGVDSRTILAIALYHGIDLNLYSIKRLDTDVWDNAVPQIIAKKTQLPFQIFKEHRVNNMSFAMKLVYDHCGGRVTAGTELTQFMNNIDVGDVNSCVLWGPLWEIGIHYYSQYFPQNAENESLDSVINMINTYGNGMFNQSEVHRLSFEAWAKHVFENPIPGMTWLDRLYWEQRVGSWAKNSLQMIDLFDSNRIIPVNCQNLLETLTSFDLRYNTPTGKEAQKDLIKKCAPELAKIRYGNGNSVFYKSENKIVKKLRNIRE